MAKPQVGNSKDNEYYTPKAIIEHFGIFDYDPATVPEKAAEFNIKNYDTIQTNGLVTDWTKFKKIWCNPPFTEKHIFLEKAVKTFKKSKTEIFVLFPIEFMTTKRFHEIMADQGGVIYLPNGRIKFESGLGKKSSSPAFGSIILKLTNDPNLVIERMEL